MKVELICFLYNKKLADMDVDHEDLLAKLTIDTNEIESVRECGKDDELETIDKGSCMLYFKSGQSFKVGKGYQEMLKIWNSEDEKVYHDLDAQ